MTSLFNGAVLRTFCAMGLAMTSAAWAADQVEYTVIELGPQTWPGEVAWPNKINDNGEVVGTSYDSLDRAQPFVYRDGVRQVLGGPNTLGIALDINNAGDISCFIREGNLSYSVLMFRNGNQLNLNQALGTGVWSPRLNNVGNVVANTLNGPVIYTPATGKTVWLGNVQFGGAVDINDRGEVLRSYTDERGVSFGMLFSGGVHTSFHAAGPREYTVALILNNQGQIAGNVHDEFFNSRPFIYQKGHFNRLGTLKGDDTAQAWGMNDLGEVVGRSTIPDGYRAFICRKHKMTDLNQLIPPGSGWVLETATAINNKGQIVGVGYFQGHEHNFLLTPVGQTRK